MCEEYLNVFSNILDKSCLDNLAKKNRGNFRLNDLIQNILEALSSRLTAKYSCTSEDIKSEEDNSFISSFVDHIPKLFPCRIFLDAFKEYFKSLIKKHKDNEQVLRLCRIVEEVIKSSSLLWLWQLKGNQHFGMNGLEKGKEEVANFLCFLLGEVDLMPITGKDLQSQTTVQTKSTIMPRILSLCESVLMKICKNSEGIPEDIFTSLKVSILKKVACQAAMVAMQHRGESVWISDMSRKAGLDLLEVLMMLCGCKNIKILLSGSTGLKENTKSIVFPSGLLGKILEHIKYFAEKDKLVEFPVVLHVFLICVHNVSHPFLGQHISMILPPSLNLIDDFRVENRVAGIRALEHIIDNTNSTELCWYGRADVIYEALHHRIHTNEPEVMLVLQPCLLKILKVIEPLPAKPLIGRKMNKCDMNFNIILTAMEFESKILLRRAYCSHLPKFVEHMGITVLRHFKCLLRVVTRYLDVSDGNTEDWRLSMLDTLNSMIVVAWPQIPSHANKIIKSLMKVLIDVAMSDIVLVEVKGSIFEKIGESLLLLLCSCGQPVQEQLTRMRTGLGLWEAEELISNTLQYYTSNSKKSC